MVEALVRTVGNFWQSWIKHCIKHSILLTCICICAVYICTYLWSVYLIFARVESWHGRATGDQSLCQTSPGGTTLRYSFLLLGLLWLNKKSGNNSFQTVRHHQKGERLHFLNNYFYLYLCVFLIPHIISRILLDSWNKHGSTWYQIK